jgi:hypothetical protein
MESIELSPNAITLDSVISFTIALINAGQTLAAWAAPRALALEEYIRDTIDSHLGANPMGQAALASEVDIQMPILKDHPNLSEFDNRVGRLMVLAHLRWGLRIPDLEYKRIAAVVDQQGWKPLRQLEGYTRKELATWNQQSRRPVHSFEQALAPKCKFRRAALRRFYRAYDKYRKMNPQLSE